LNLWVLDCSLAVATFLPDENSKLADQFFTKLQNENKAIVPPIMRNIYELGKKHTLSIYDSAYLELCIRKNAGLGSLDEKLIQSAKKEKVKFLLWLKI
jgi:predicted nucleic acid-binding protein